MHAAAAELDEEEHVHPLQPDGLHREEVDGEHALRLRAQELTPGETGALAGRSQTRSLEDRAHRRRRNRGAASWASRQTIASALAAAVGWRLREKLDLPDSAPAD
jgi:hypothetical protein